MSDLPLSVGDRVRLISTGAEAGHPLPEPPGPRVGDVGIIEEINVDALDDLEDADPLAYRVAWNRDDVSWQGCWVSRTMVELEEDQDRE